MNVPSQCDVVPFTGSPFADTVVMQPGIPWIFDTGTNQAFGEELDL